MSDEMAIILAVTMGLSALVCLVHGIRSFWPLPTLSSASPKAPSIMAITLPAIGTLEGYAADPIVQLILVNLLSAIATKVEAATADPALNQLEQLGFALVIGRLKALANTAPAIPAAMIKSYKELASCSAVSIPASQ
jgi:hypothetical protein